MAICVAFRGRLQSVSQLIHSQSGFGRHLVGAQLAGDPGRTIPTPPIPAAPRRGQAPLLQWARAGAGRAPDYQHSASPPWPLVPRPPFWLMLSVPHLVSFAWAVPDFGVAVRMNVLAVTLPAAIV